MFHFMKKLFFLSILMAAVGAFAYDAQVGRINDAHVVGRATAGNDGKLYLWDKKGEVIVGWPKDFSNEQRFFSYPPRMQDVDSDLQDEIIAVSEHRQNHDLILHVFEGTGQEIQNWR